MKREGRVPYAVSLSRPAAKFGDWREEMTAAVEDALVAAVSSGM